VQNLCRTSFSSEYHVACSYADFSLSSSRDKFPTWIKRRRELEWLIWIYYDSMNLIQAEVPPPGCDGCTSAHRNVSQNMKTRSHREGIPDNDKVSSCQSSALSYVPFNLLSFASGKIRRELTLLRGKNRNLRFPLKISRLQIELLKLQIRIKPSWYRLPNRIRFFRRARGLLRDMSMKRSAVISPRRKILRRWNYFRHCCT